MKQQHKMKQKSFYVDSDDTMMDVIKHFYIVSAS